MNAVVADASYCGAWIFEDEVSQAADEMLESVVAGNLELRVPALWHYEMTNMLRSAQRRNRITATAVNTAARLLEQVPLRYVDTPDATARRHILQLAEQFSLSAYDAAYLELAQRFKLPLLSTDRRLLEAKGWMDQER